MRKLSIIASGLLTLFTAACAPSESVVSTKADAAVGPAAVPSQRAVSPFSVIGAHGTPLAHPFLGGLNVPRPQLVDIDGDEDADLFVQEYTGEVMFFENVGDGSYVWHTDAYRDLPVGEWYRFADVDRDGDFDLLAEQPYSYIQYFRNVGSETEPRFVQAVDTLRDVEGEPIFSDRQNIPNVTDIDCDGQVDLFLGRLDGTITRYEAVENAEEPVFRLVTERFEDIEIVAQFGQPGNANPVMPNIPGGLPDDGPSPLEPLPNDGTRHGANTMTFADADKDGDMDLFWGDFFEASLLFIENTGSCETPVLRSEPQPFPPRDPVVSSGYNAPTFGDVDTDGDLDLMVGVLGGAFNPNRTAHANLYFYEQREADEFRLRTRRFLDQIDLGSESFPELGDLDGDGDLDLLLANKISSEDSETSVLVRYENSPEGFVVRDSLELLPSYHYAPALADLDADGDLDMLLGTWNDGLALYWNEGSASSFEPVLAEEHFLELTRGSHTTPALVDIDGDEDLDLFVGETSGTINFYRNTGSAKEPTFELVSDEFEGIDIGRRSVPLFTDIDGDGDQDLLIGSESEGLVFFENTGSVSAPSFSRRGSLPVDVPPLATPALGNLHASDRPELLVGGLGGGLFYFEEQSQ